MRKIPGTLVIDARPLFDFSTREMSKLPSDHRLTVDVRLLQEYFDHSLWKMRWVAGPQQLANVLTKVGVSPEYLHRVMRCAEYQVVRDHQLEAKVRKAGEAFKKQELDEALSRKREAEKKLLKVL